MLFEYDEELVAELWRERIGLKDGAPEEEGKLGTEEEGKGWGRWPLSEGC